MYSGGIHATKLRDDGTTEEEWGDSEKYIARVEWREKS